MSGFAMSSTLHDAEPLRCFFPFTTSFGLKSLTAAAMMQMSQA